MPRAISKSLILYFPLVSCRNLHTLNSYTTHKKILLKGKARKLSLMFCWPGHDYPNNKGSWEWETVLREMIPICKRRE